MRPAAAQAASHAILRGFHFACALQGPHGSPSRHPVRSGGRDNRARHRRRRRRQHLRGSTAWWPACACRPRATRATRAASASSTLGRWWLLVGSALPSLPRQEAAAAASAALWRASSCQIRSRCTALNASQCSQPLSCSLEISFAALLLTHICVIHKCTCSASATCLPPTSPLMTGGLCCQLHCAAAGYTRSGHQRHQHFPSAARDTGARVPLCAAHLCAGRHARLCRNARLFCCWFGSDWRIPMRGTQMSIMPDV